MGHQTEAACLLQTGALYGTRGLLRPREGDPVFAGFKAGAFSLYYGDEPIYHFDLEGRWQRAFVRGTHYLKGLDATTQAIDRVREGANLVLKRRTLGFAEASDLDAAIRDEVIELLETLGRDAEWVDPPPRARPLEPAALREMLERIARWDAAAWFAHRERYLAAYGPLPFLPPDCRNALVLQATLGHPGGVAFGLGAGAEPHVRSATEFADHALAVASLLGRRVEQSRGVFLGGGDVLRLPPPAVLAALEIIAEVFPVGGRLETAGGDAEPRPGGVHAFLDSPDIPGIGRETWTHYAAANLGRVSVGVESGDRRVRSLYGKDWEDDRLMGTIADLKGAGVGVGLIVLVDAGGVEHGESHLAATAALINDLPLGPGDLVSLLDGNELRDPGREGLGFTPLTGRAWGSRQAELRQALAPVRSRRGAKVVAYSLEKQPG